ncbi:MAG: response regulator [Nitrospira sp.]|nr:response regulator [Nitrospira sp.]
MPKVLVADDSIAVRKVAERLLTEAGMGVTLAANGEEAIACLAKDRLDMVVSDVIMPDKSGYEVCAFVRGTASIATIPVLLISGIVNDEVTKQAESCRADGVLKKPFQGTSLKDKVMELLAKRQTSVAPPQEFKPTAAPIQSPPPIPTIGLRPAPTSTAAPAVAPLSGYKPIQTQPINAPDLADPQAASRLREAEEQLRSERARAESLTKRIADLETAVGRAKETEALLEGQRRLVNELEMKVMASEIQASRVFQLEAALRVEQESSAKARQEVAVLQETANRVEQLEVELSTERAAAAQLVQALTELENAAAHGKNAEAMLAHEMQRAAGFEEKARAAEASLVVVQARVKELTEIAESGVHVTRRIGELEALLETERERNAVLVNQVSETEQVAVSATKRLEEMVRTLREISGLASQFGKGI